MARTLPEQAVKTLNEKAVDITDYLKTEIRLLMNLATETQEFDGKEHLIEFSESMCLSEINRSLQHWVTSLSNQLKKLQNEIQE